MPVPGQPSPVPSAAFNLLRGAAPRTEFIVHFPHDRRAPYASVLRLIEQGRLDWAGSLPVFELPDDGFVKLRIGPDFDFDQFRALLGEVIGHLEIIAAPRIDLTVLERDGAAVHYRFRLNGLGGARALLALHQRKLVVLDHAASLTNGIAQGALSQADRRGYFESRMAGEAGLEVRHHFETEIVPYLELLAPQ